MEIHYLMLLIGMGLVTYLPRLFPLLLFTYRELPAWFKGFLDFLPAAILSALVLPGILLHGEARQLALWQPHLLAAVPTFIFAWKTRSLAGTVLTGMASFWCLSHLLK